MSSRAPTSRADVPTPRSIRRAGSLVALQGSVLVGVAVVLTVRASTGGHQAVASGYGTALWFTVFGGGLLVAGMALVRGRRGGRGPATIAQVLFLPVAYSLLTASHQVLLGVLLAVLVVLTLSQLFSRASAEWMDAQYEPLPEDDPDDPAGSAPGARPVSLPRRER